MSRITTTLDEVDSSTLAATLEMAAQLSVALTLCWMAYKSRELSHGWMFIPLAAFALWQLADDELPSLDVLSPAAADRVETGLAIGALAFSRLGAKNTAGATKSKVHNDFK